MASSEIAFAFPLAQGLHARPASLLAAAAARFTAAVALVHEGRGESADARSPLALVGLDVQHRDPCRLVAIGGDAAAAIAALRDVIERVLPAGEERPPAPPAAAATALPRTLRADGLRWLPGTIASPGVGRGAVVRVSAPALAEAAAGAFAGPVAVETERVRRALAAVGAALAPETSAPAGPAAELRAAYRAMVADPALEHAILERVDAGAAAAGAVARAIGAFAARLRAAHSELLHERAVDLEDLGLQLLEALGLAPPAAAAPALRGPAVLVADALAPRQVLALDREWVRGLVLERGGTTSHALVLARSFGIPALTGVAHARAVLPAGADVVVDAELGAVIVMPDARATRHYERRARAARRRDGRASLPASDPVQTTDGRRLEVGANISSAAEVEAAVVAGAEGIGLFRTEMLFMGRDEPPGEEEQLAAYAAAVRAAAGRAVTIRTLDAGGDKPIPFLRVAPEANPFLGVRGVRLYPSHAALLQVQLRAILRASALGRVRVLVPMVTTLEEVRWFRARLAEARSELAAAGQVCDPHVPLGVMIEVPAAALAAAALAREVDFFSVGTNDLAQYLFAADRGNAAVGALREARHPVLLRLLRDVVEAAHRHGLEVGLCGEMAAEPENVPLLLGLGLDEISAAAPRLPALRAAVARASAAAAGALVEAALRCSTAAEVATELERARAPRATGLLDRDLVVLDSDAATREEAIEDAVAALAAAGRTDRPREVEEAVWEREATYSTGLGFGFAIPHAATDAVKASSIVVLRCARPLEWGAHDGAPVHSVILLVVRASDAAREHLKNLARLARRLVDEDFRYRLVTAPCEDDVLRLLADALGLPAGPA